jgi:hypothetical protein
MKAAGSSGWISPINVTYLESVQDKPQITYINTILGTLGKG